MAMGTLTMAWLMLVSGTVPADVSPINQRKFEIPIQIDAASRSKIKELKLFSSTDEGRSWQEVAVTGPDKGAFVYYAPTDGEYWFLVQIVDQQSRPDPADIYKLPPDVKVLKVLVDTLKPLLRIVSAERQGDDVAVSWEIQEDHPDLATLKLEYRAADAELYQWQSTTLDPGMHGQTHFRVTNPAALTIRMQVQDLAGNLTTTQAEVAALPAPATTVASASSTGSHSTSLISREDKMPHLDMPPIKPPTVGSDRGPALPSDAGLGSSGPSAPPEHPSVQQGAPLAHSEPRGLADHSAGQGAIVPPPWSNPESGTHLVATTENNIPPMPPSPTVSSTRPAAAQLPSLQVINSTQVTLEYEVGKFGPSGVGSVEVYLTRDDGATWQRFAADQEVKIPPSPEPGGPAASIRRPITVELPGEGVYGFYLVVRSGAGLGKPPPQNGDPPQMRIEVDTTRPVAQLFAPEPVAGRRDALILNWTASDRNLASTPITLQWAERQGGPWETIGADLPNSGHHTWKLPPNLPYRVFLRLSARDTAGNLGIAETREPVLVDLSEPDAHFVGVAPRGGHER
jgi:hypothetical protein